MVILRHYGGKRVQIHGSFCLANGTLESERSDLRI